MGNWLLSPVSPLNEASLPFTPTFTEGENGAYTYSYSYQAGDSPGDGTITLSNNPGVRDLTHVLVGTLSSGSQIYVNLLSDFESQYGLKTGSLTSDLFWAIFDLHELGHVLAGLKSDRNDAALSKANTSIVVNNCFKDLLK